MTAPGPVSLERLAAELRDLHRQRDDLMRSAGTVPAFPDEVSAIMDRYDRLLVDAAVMLQVDVPREARSTIDPTILTHHGRVTLEEALLSAGLDVRWKQA